MDMLTRRDVVEKTLRAEAVFRDDYSFDCRVNQDFGYEDLECSSSAQVEPTAYFRLALVKCISNYVKEFCKHRQIPVADIIVKAKFLAEEYSVREIERIHISVSLPETFPDKYKRAIDSLISQCKIVSILTDPPELNWELQGCL